MYGLFFPTWDDFFCVPQAALARHQWVRIERVRQNMGGIGSTCKKLWKITIFNGNINYFYGHF